MDAEETSGIVEVLQAMCFASTCNVHFMEFYARERERERCSLSVGDRVDFKLCARVL